MDPQVDPDQPDWWLANEQLKEYLGLPPYNPPRFEDGAYLHDIVPGLEERHACNIQFVGVNTEYLEDWEVRIDRVTAFEIGRQRDENGNTTFMTESDEFVQRVEQWHREN